MAAWSRAAAIRVRQNEEGVWLAYDLALDVKNHDLLLDGRDLLLIDDAERVAQQIKVALLFCLGEWFLDTKKGVPYLEYVLIKNPNMAHVRQVLYEAISGVPDVMRVSKLDVQLNQRSREAVVSYSAETDFGLVTKREVLGYGDG